MRLVLSALLALIAGTGAAQPLATHVPSLDGARVVLILEASSDGAPAYALTPNWEAPPGLYWAGVAVDVAALAAGGTLTYLGATLLGYDAAASPAGPVVIIMGALLLTVGVGAAALAGYDLVRVLSGDDPALARLFDPTRRLPRGPHPPYPGPQIPRYAP